MDEWVMERYKLAKERIVQIPEENIVRENGRRTVLRFFYKGSNVFTAGDSCDGPWNCGEKS